MEREGRERKSEKKLERGGFMQKMGRGGKRGESDILRGKKWSDASVLGTVGLVCVHPIADGGLFASPLVHHPP